MAYIFWKGLGGGKMCHTYTTVAIKIDKDIHHFQGFV